MKCCSNPNCELVFLLLARVMRKLIEKRFEGKVKYTLVYSGKTKTDASSDSLLSGCCYRQRLNDYSASITRRQSSCPT